MPNVRRSPPPADAPRPIPYRAELVRKALHLLALVLPLGAWFVGAPTAQIVLGGLSATALTADVLRARSVGFERFITRAFGWMMRAEEKPPVPGPVVVNGATWVVTSLFLLTLLFPLNLALPVFAAFMVADAAAALVGRRFGRNRWPGTPRTVEGTVAFFAVAAAILLALGVATLPALVCAAVCAGIEVLPGPFNDNLQVPLAGALVLLLFTL